MNSLKLSIIAILFLMTVLFTPTFAQDGDADGDGVLDSQDLCPREKGTKENQGCPGKNADTDKKVVGQSSTKVQEILSGPANQIAALTAKIAAAPLDDKLYVERARAHWELNKYARATADIDKALTINPNNSEAVKLQKDFLKKTYSDPTGAIVAQYAEDLKSMESEKAAAKCVSGNCVNGKGKYLYPNGDIYEGDWVAGKYNGKGRFKNIVGNIYEGDFVDGKRQGEGTFTYGGGSVYTGQFANHQMNGKGKMKYSDGDVYDGDYVNDLREGKGRLTLKNGEYYTGEWKNGKRNGYGKEYIKATNTTRQGIWKDSVFVGDSLAKVPKTESEWQKICEPYWSKMDEALKKKDIDSAKKIYAEFNAETKDANNSIAVKVRLNLLLKQMYLSGIPQLKDFVESELKRLKYTDKEKEDVKKDNSKGYYV